jgi:hypothetical protein
MKNWLLNMNKCIIPNLPAATSVNKNYKKNVEKKHTSTAEHISRLPQAIALILQIPQIYTNVSFIHLPIITLHQCTSLLIIHQILLAHFFSIFFSMLIIEYQM